MDIAMTDSLPFALPTYSQLIWCHDKERGALWYYLNPKPRPCFSRTLLAEICDFQSRVAEFLQQSPDHADDIRYLVLASATPRVFNLGGDVELFARLISERQREVLYDYGRACVSAVYMNAINLGVPTLTTVSLVQGMALGGGFEAALSSNVLIAEQGAQLGFPEIIFNLFPGMGAFSFLSRRVDMVRAQRLIESGEQYSAEALGEMGVVDVVAPAGEGVQSVNDFLRRYDRLRNGYQAMRQVRQRVSPIKYEELMDIVEIWVDAAMRVTPRDIRVMTKIASAQHRLDPVEEEVPARTPVSRMAEEARAPIPA